MAGDWIKMRTDLYRDPKVIVIADCLLDRGGPLAASVNQQEQREMAVTRNVMRNVTVGALVSVWGIARHRGHRDGDDLRIEKVTVSVVDDIAEIPGFGEAMKTAGWLKADSKGLIFPNFFSSYNADPNDDERAKNRERQRRFRESRKSPKDNVTVTLHNALEKSREENIKEAGSPPADPGPVWKESLTILTEQGQSEKSARAFLGMLCREYDESSIADAVKQSVGKADAAAYIRGVLRNQPKKGALDRPRLAI